MKKAYIHIEKYFEKIAAGITAVLGSSISFVAALAMIIFWFGNRNYEEVELNEVIRDIIHGLSFLSLFVIQKEFNRFSGSLHLKVNELVTSTETADNSVIHAEKKTEQEITELAKEHAAQTEKSHGVDALTENNENVWTT